MDNKKKSALIKCPGCGEDIPDGLLACPRCRYLFTGVGKKNKTTTNRFGSVAQEISDHFGGYASKKNVNFSSVWHDVKTLWKKLFPVLAILGLFTQLSTIPFQIVFDKFRPESGVIEFSWNLIFASAAALIVGLPLFLCSWAGALVVIESKKKHPESVIKGTRAFLMGCVFFKKFFIMAVIMGLVLTTVILPIIFLSTQNTNAAISLISVFGILTFIYFKIRWSLTAPIIVFEKLSVISALKRSSMMVKGTFFAVLLLNASFWLITLIVQGLFFGGSNSFLNITGYLIVIFIIHPISFVLEYSIYRRLKDAN